MPVCSSSGVRVRISEVVRDEIEEIRQLHLFQFHRM